MNFNSALLKMKENCTEYTESKLKATPVAMVAPEMKQNTDDTEITKTCAVLGCDDSKNLSSEEFFRFPEDPSQRQIWTNLTGRNNWTPTDYSYVCIQHFSVDCFECNASDQVVLTAKAVPSQKLPGHVFEVEYIEEESLDNDDEEDDLDDLDGNMDIEMIEDEIEQTESNIKLNGNTHNGRKRLPSSSYNDEEKEKVLKLFTEVQTLQRHAVTLKDKLKMNTRIHNRQSRFLNRLQQLIETKQRLLSQKKKKKARILLSLQDKIKEDTNGLVMAMPMKHTEDLKNFALSIYKYSPQAYVYIRNSLRTMLPSTDVLDNWLDSGVTPRNVMASNNTVKLTAEQTESELTCKISLR